MDSTGKRILGFFACLIVLLSGVMVLGAIAPNTIGNLGGVLPLFNATAGGYWVDTTQIVDDDRNAYFENLTLTGPFLNGYNITDVAGDVVDLEAYYDHRVPHDLPDLNGLMAKHPNVHIVDTFEDDGTWTAVVAGTATITWGTTKVHSGNESAVFKVDGASNCLLYDHDHFAADPLDLTKKSIGLWVNFDSITAGSTIVIEYRLAAPDTSNQFRNRVVYRDIGYNPNQWIYVGLVPQAYYQAIANVGNPDITDVRGLQIWIYTGGGTFNVYVDSITVVDHMFPNGAVVLSFDGPYTSQFKNAFPIMQELGLKGVMWTVTDWVDSGAGYLNTTDLKTLQAAGWDIASHSSEMLNYQTATDAEIRTATAKAYNWLVSNGFSDGARFFSYPYGSSRINNSLILDDYHVLYRDIGQNDNMPGLPLFDPTFVPCLPGKGNLVTAKAEVDNLKLTGGFGMYYWHNIQTPKQAGELTTAEFRELMEYIVAQNVTVVTLSDIVDKYLPYAPTTDTIYIRGNYYAVGDTRWNAGSLEAWNSTAWVVIGP